MSVKSMCVIDLGLYYRDGNGRVWVQWFGFFENRARPLEPIQTQFFHIFHPTSVSTRPDILAVGSDCSGFRRVWVSCSALLKKKLPRFIFVKDKTGYFFVKNDLSSIFFVRDQNKFSV
jgi:hypothetical protein